MRPKLIKTEDGSHSLFIEELNETYHSTHGAIQESKHIFIEAGLKNAISNFDPVASGTSLTIFEVGFGTGLNAFLTCLESSRLEIQVNYTAVEPFPLDLDLVKELNFASLLATPQNPVSELKALFEKIHTVEWNQQHRLSNYFNLHKLKSSVQDASLQNIFHVVYFDAFAPAVQPEMWTSEIFAKIYDALLVNGCLVTYCAKGSVKRTLKEIGFVLEPLKGPPGKREMIRAWKRTQLETI